METARNIKIYRGRMVWGISMMALGSGVFGMSYPRGVGCSSCSANSRNADANIGLFGVESGQRLQHYIQIHDMLNLTFQ